VDAGELAGVLAFGLVGGFAGGLLGVGGAVLFVPALVVFAEFTQLEAEATSLLAVAVVGLVGAARQHRYGNLRLRDGLLIGALSPLGVAGGTVLANSLPQRALELSFAGVQLYFAWRLARRALRPASNAFPPAA
jgi:uncharacterized membrane protein YfcA